MARNRYTRDTDFIAHFIADILARIAFFVGTALAMLFFLWEIALEHSISHWEEMGRWELAIILGPAVFAALFGPQLYRKDVMRGRGSLKSVKERSRQEP